MIWPQQRKRQERRAACITSVQTTTATNDVFLQRVANTRSTLTALENFPPIALVNSWQTDSHVMYLLPIGHHVGTCLPRHSQNGVSPDRLRRLTSLNHCRCHRRKCFLKISRVHHLQSFLQVFWSLSRPLQDLYVRSPDPDGLLSFMFWNVLCHPMPACKLSKTGIVQVMGSRVCSVNQVKQTVGDCKLAQRKTWFLLGCRLSPKCLVAIIGMGNSRIRRIMYGGMDRRFKLWGGDTCQQVYSFENFHALVQFTIETLLVIDNWFAKGSHRCAKKKKEVDLFLLDLYIKAASMLPAKLLSLMVLAKSFNHQYPSIFG